MIQIIINRPVGLHFLQTAQAKLQFVRRAWNQVNQLLVQLRAVHNPGRTARGTAWADHPDAAPVPHRLPPRAGSTRSRKYFKPVPKLLRGTRRHVAAVSRRVRHIPYLPVGMGALTSSSDASKQVLTPSAARGMLFLMAPDTGQTEIISKGTNACLSDIFNNLL